MSGSETTGGQNALVTILDVEIARITHAGEPVTTFAQIDHVHQRPAGTAGRTFRENRKRFDEPVDFVVGNLDEIRRAFPGAAPPRGGGEIILLTKRGYLKLTKPMSDDRAWAVQGEMIERYFAAEAQTAPDLRAVREVRLFLNQSVSFGRLAGLTGNQLAIAASRRTAKATGVDALADMGIDHLVAPTNDPLIIPTAIGQRLGVSARRVNLALQGLGLQVDHGDHKGGALWQPTEAGIAAGAAVVDVERSNKTGSAQQLKWPTAIVERVRAHLDGEVCPSVRSHR